MVDDRGPHARDRRPFRQRHFRLEPPVGAGDGAAQHQRQQRARNGSRQLAPAAWRPRRGGGRHPPALLPPPPRLELVPPEPRPPPRPGRPRPPPPPVSVPPRPRLPVLLARRPPP